MHCQMQLTKIEPTNNATAANKSMYGFILWFWMSIVHKCYSFIEYVPKNLS